MNKEHCSNCCDLKEAKERDIPSVRLSLSQIAGHLGYLEGVIEFLRVDFMCHLRDIAKRPSDDTDVSGVEEKLDRIAEALEELIKKKKGVG